ARWPARAQRPGTLDCGPGSDGCRPVPAGYLATPSRGPDRPRAPGAGDDPPVPAKRASPAARRPEWSRPRRARLGERTASVGIGSRSRPGPSTTSNRQWAGPTVDLQRTNQPRPHEKAWDRGDVAVDGLP